MKNTKWTEDEIDLLLEKYSNYGPKKMSEFLDRTPRSILERAKMYKLKMNEECRLSLLRKHDESDLRNIVSNSSCYADVMRGLNLQPKAGNYKTIKRYIELYSIDISHFKKVGELTKERWEKDKISGKIPTKSLNDYLVKNVKRTSNAKIKSLLFESGIKKRVCELCGTDENWNGKKLSLILDHIDGDNTNYTLDNLQIVCPNCDATLDTFCYRNVKNRAYLKNTCNCGKIIDRDAKRCFACYNKERENHNIPNLTQLEDDVRNFGYKGTGRKYNVSDNTIRKWLQKNKK